MSVASRWGACFKQKVFQTALRAGARTRHFSTYYYFYFFLYGVTGPIVAFDFFTYYYWSRNKYCLPFARDELTETSGEYIFSPGLTTMCGSRSSSGSLTTDRTIGVRSPTGAENFSSSPCVQTGSGAHPASYPMGTGGKARPGRNADHSPPSSAVVTNE
jgi:hypothetical protein